MAATELYTLSVHENGTVIFELQAEAYARALDEAQLESDRLKGLYKLFLDEDLPKEGFVRQDKYAIYLGEDICTVYEEDKPPYIVPLPNLQILKGQDPRGQLENEAFRNYILAEVIGYKNLTIQRHIQAYREANPHKSTTVAFKRTYIGDGIVNIPTIENLKDDIFIRYSDGQYRDERFRVVAKTSIKESPVLYTYTATEQDNQITLRMDAPQDTYKARQALEKLKRFATHLLPLKNPQDPKTWPRIEIQGEGSKTLFENEIVLSHLVGDEEQNKVYAISIIIVAAAVIALLVLVPLFIPLLTPVFIGLGIFLGLALSGTGYALWRQNQRDKIEKYNAKDILGHELLFLSDIPKQNIEKAVSGKIYLDTNGDYIVRNTANGLRHGAIEQDKIEPARWKTLLNGQSLKSQINNPDFKKAILEITTLKGYTARDAYERDLAEDYHRYFIAHPLGKPSPYHNTPNMETVTSKVASTLSNEGAVLTMPHNRPTPRGQ